MLQKFVLSFYPASNCNYRDTEDGDTKGKAIFSCSLLAALANIRYEKHPLSTETGQH